MAAKKAKKQANGNAGVQKPSDGDQGAAASESSAKPAAKARTKTARGRGGPPGKKSARKPARPRKMSVAKAISKKSGSSARGKKRYSDAERHTILATARSEGLTGAQIAKRFGISQVTYYLWRKKSGTAKRRKDPVVAAGVVVGKTLGRAVHLADAIRQEVRAQISRLMPDIVKSEIGSAMAGPTAGLMPRPCDVEVVIRRRAH